MKRLLPYRPPSHRRRGRPLLAAGLALAALLALAACNGEDITSLPEAKGLCGGKSGSPVTLGYSSRSWWGDTGFHQLGSDGFLIGGWADATPDNYGAMRGFAAFSLVGFAGCVRSAALLVMPELNLGTDPTEAYSLWQVTTDEATLNADWTAPPLNPAVYADLGDGLQYGAFTVNEATDLGLPLTIPLSPLAALEATAHMGGTFIVGLRADSLTRPPGAYEGFRFGIGGDATPTQLLLEVVP